jgi:gliding motility-associated-like protein
MKKVNSLLLVFFLSITSIIGQVNLKNGLVACYPFNANTKDESGNGNNGTVNGATLTIDRFGKANSAYNFDGSSQFIEISPAQFQNNNYSFSIWANPDITPPTNTYFYPFSVGGSGGDQSIDLSNSANGATGWTFGGYSVGGGRVPFCDQAFLPPPAKWYHIVGIRDNNKMTLYVNGQLVKTDDTGGFLPSYGTNTKVTIGCRSSLVQYFQGKVDDLHIYNRPITADEVKALFESNNTSPTITISASNPTSCGGDKITFTANGAITSAKYQWKVDGVNQGTNSKTFDYTFVKKTGDYTVKITVEVTDEDVCFPQKPSTIDQTITIKDCTPPSTGVNLKNGLVACYPFNANAKDESGNNNNGTINGGVSLTADRFGKANSAYTFNGIDGFINVPDAPSLKFEQISIAMWIKATQFREFTNSVRSWDRYGGPICRDVRPQGTWSGFTTATSHGLLRISVAMADKTASQLGIENSVDLDVWDFIVFMIDDGVEKIYRNGILVVNEPLNKGKKMHPNTEPIFIGRAFWLPSQVQLDTYFTGQIDDIHIYNRPLNEDEIKALYNGISPASITISASNSTPCGGDKITFTANGATNTSKYQWKVDDVNQGTNSKTFDYTSVKKTGDYTVKITVEVTDEDVCFPQKPSTIDQTITIKDCTPPPTGVNLKNGLVACYPFNANAKDESGNGNNGTVKGATLTTDRFGKANSAYNFNGSSYISVDPAQFKNQSYSYATWVNLDNVPTGTGYQYSFISIGATGGDQVLSLTGNYQAPAANGFNGAAYNLGNPVVSRNWTNTTPSKSRWYHLVFIRDNTSVKLYVDGQLISDNSTSLNTNGTSPNYETPTSFTIGSRVGASGYFQFTQGSLDDIHIYNRPLNAFEVKTLFEGEKDPAITITADNYRPCGGDKITFTANGATNTSKYQWKVDGVNQGTNSKTFEYTSVKKTGGYSVKISVEVSSEDPCFPQKPVTTEQSITMIDCVIPPPTGVNLKDGLVACYPFNANAKDESGNGNNGTVNGANLTADRFGKANSAYSFDGSNFIALPTDKFALNEFSYAVWIYIASNPALGDAYRILSIGGNCGDQDINTGNTYFQGSFSGIGGGGYNISTPTSNSGVVTGSLPTIGQWYHGVITRDKNEIKLYVNGVLVRSVSTNGTLPYYGCDGKVFANIGTRSTQTQFFIGNIDDVHIYKRALNAEEVKALFDGNSGQKITISNNKSNPCGGDKITFTANGATNTSKYQWKVDGVNQGTNSKSFIYSSPTKSADYQVKITVEVTDEDPCFPQKPAIIDKTITIKFCASPVPNASNNILIPNAFSPNGDGVNDTWDIYSVTGNSEVIVEIYNRWGELIFYSKGYSEPWNGTYKDKPVMEGTYAYTVRVDNDTVLRGTILVVR